MKNGRPQVEPTKMIIGWREWLALPQLGIPAIKAKIDTGARTSALHTFSLEEFSAGDRRMVRFGIHPLQKRRDFELFCEAPVLERRRVKDSGGHIEKRYVIQTEVVLKNEIWRINVTLTNRDAMLFRMLLGRTAIAKRFVVDPGRSYLNGRALAKAYADFRSKKDELVKSRDSDGFEKSSRSRLANPEE